MSSPESTLAGVAPSRIRVLLASLRGHSSLRVFSGSIIMLFGSGFVSLASFGYNIAVARLLGPSDFSHAATAVTLLMLASCINLSFQLVAAKFIARNDSPGAKATVYHALMRRAWMVGASLCVGLCLLSVPISNYLRMPSATFIIILALSMLFYVPLGVKRGGFQGTTQFLRLSMSLALEAVVKFIAAIILVKLGFGVLGAVSAISISVVLAYLVPGGDEQFRSHPEAAIPASFREGMQAMIFFVGQVIINNIDILMVKHFFRSDEAGLYAAIALVGRLLYFATWMVTSAMFPISAGAKAETDSRRVLLVPIAFVIGLSTVFVVFLWAFPNFVLTTVFGSSFRNISADAPALLTMNAIAMGVYALAVVLIAYEMSRKVANTGWFQLLVSGLIVLGIVFYHQSLMSVIIVQQVLRLLLLVAVAFPFLRKSSTVHEVAA
jgi:O-antigen/teichoic acid export membrane protein